MKLYKLDKSTLNPEDGREPEVSVGYLAPTVGTFTLFAKSEETGEIDTKKGQAAFVWSHEHNEPHDNHTHQHLVLDWHHHKLEYAGSTVDDNYWAYTILDPGTDADVDLVLLAKSRTDSGVDHGHGGAVTHSEDEGYRIFYVAHEEYHLWAWDARTFIGHDEDHDNH